MMTIIWWWLFSWVHILWFLFALGKGDDVRKGISIHTGEHIQKLMFAICNIKLIIGVKTYKLIQLFISTGFHVIWSRFRRDVWFCIYGFSIWYGIIIWGLKVSIPYLTKPYQLVWFMNFFSFIKRTFSFSLWKKTLFLLADFLQDFTTRITLRHSKHIIAWLKADSLEVDLTERCLVVCSVLSHHRCQFLILKIFLLF